MNRFGELFKAGEDILMLVLVDYKVAALIHLKDGNRWAKPEKIESSEYVTDHELNLLANGTKLEAVPTGSYKERRLRASLWGRQLP